MAESTRRLIFKALVLKPANYVGNQMKRGPRPNLLCWSGRRSGVQCWDNMPTRRFGDLDILYLTP